MRQITREAVIAFKNGERFNKSNTRVSPTDNKDSFLYLHDNLIASIYNGRLELSACGWETNTTKERLNGILDLYDLGVIKQKNFSWFLHKPSGEVVPFDSVMTFNI